MIKTKPMLSKGLLTALVLTLLVSSATVISVKVAVSEQTNMLSTVDDIVKSIHTRTKEITKKTTIVKKTKTCKLVNKCKLAKETARNFARSVAMLVIAQGAPEEVGYDYVTRMLNNYGKADKLDPQCFLDTFKRLYPKSFRLFGMDHYETICQKTKCTKVEQQEVNSMLNNAQEKHRYLIAEYEASELEPTDQEKQDLEQELTRLEEVMQRLSIRVRSCTTKRRIDFVNKRNILDYEDKPFNNKRARLDDDEFWINREKGDVSIIDIRHPKKPSIDHELDQELELIHLRGLLDQDPDNPFKDLDKIYINQTWHYVKERIIHRRQTERFDLKERFTFSEKEIIRLRILRKRYIKDPSRKPLIILIDREIAFLTNKLHVIVEEVDAMDWINKQLREIEREVQRSQLIHPNNHTVIIDVLQKKENVTRTKEEKKLQIERVIYIDEIVNVEDLIDELQKELKRIQTDPQIPVQEKLARQDRIKVRLIDLEEQKRDALENFLDKVETAQTL